MEEEYTKDALRLRDDYVERAVDIASPGLLPFEVLNALRYNPSFVEGQLKDVATALEKYNLWLFPLEGEFTARCVENSLKHGISVYDLAYVSLGEVKGSPVYTADRRLVEKVGGENLRLVSSY